MTKTVEVELVNVPEFVKTRADERRSRIIGYILLALSGVVFGVFAFGVTPDAKSTFNLSLPTDAIQDLSISVNSRLFSTIMAVIILALGIDRLRARNLRWTNTALGVGLLAFVLAFLTWASADGAFNMVGMLRSTVISAVVITLGALTGLTCERAGVINIGIEGQLLTAAFVAVVLSSAFGTWAGVAGAMVIGAVLGALLAWLAIRFLVDQIVAGVVINILALGLTSFLASRVLSEAQDLNAPARVPSWPIPILSDIPIVGPMFFDHTFFVYATYLLVAALHFGLFRTRWGLRARSVGEHPKAADTVGIDVLKTRYRNVISAGLIAGFGGAFLALAQISRFEENMTGGIGFIGLAAMIFGRWMPFGALAAGLVFGFSGALAQRVGILGTGIPSEFMLMLPYVATVIVVAGLVGQARPPAADGQPYIKQ
ncbi:MAG TPA: ABC transporter permease [Acidimicrobiia bacterium]|jgi:simple sugar transport system permease protein|nr:ABC transporter permease [Acidimicrobiia bacterium]